MLLAEVMADCHEEIAFVRAELGSNNSAQSTHLTFCSMPFRLLPKKRAEAIIY